MERGTASKAKARARNAASLRKMKTKSKVKVQINGKRKRKEFATEKHDITLGDQMDDIMTERPSKKSLKDRKQQDMEEYMDAGMTNKVLKEALKQQLEIEKERDSADELAGARKAFSAIADNNGTDDDTDEEDEDPFFSNQSEYGEYEEMSKEEEQIMSMFMAKDAAPQRTLTEMIMEKINGSGIGNKVANNQEGRVLPGMDNKVMEVYRGVGKLLSRYNSGKLPKAFKILPALSNWEDILYLTSPEKWTANSLYQATRLFASNLNDRMAQRFYNLVLLPRIREDIRVNKRLHFALYQALKKAVYKPGAFYRGIIFPLCQSRTCNLREAVIIGSVIQKVSIPALHSSVALLKIAEMEYCGTNSYFLKLLMDKKYALPYRVLDSLVAHFTKFMEDDRTPPVIWHQCLLTFVQRYKNELSANDKESLKRLMHKHNHYLVTAEIQRELHQSSNRGQKEESTYGVSVLNGATGEDIWNLPEVQVDMEL